MNWASIETAEICGTEMYQMGGCQSASLNKNLPKKKTTITF
jgi:hypothetical protein